MKNNLWQFLTFKKVTKEVGWNEPLARLKETRKAPDFGMLKDGEKAKSKKKKRKTKLSLARLGLARLLFFCLGHGGTFLHNFLHIAATRTLLAASESLKP